MRDRLTVGLALWSGVFLIAWGAMRLLLGEAPFGFVNLRQASAGQAGALPSTHFSTTLGFRKGYSAGENVYLLIPYSSRMTVACFDFFLDSAYYKPDSRTAREAFEFEVLLGERILMNYSIAENDRKKYFKLGPVQSSPNVSAMGFRLTANHAHVSKSWLRASEVNISNLRAYDCDDE